MADSPLAPSQCSLVFLGVDERSAPESAKSLPLSKPDDNSTLETHSPYGVPYWAVDVSSFGDLKSSAQKDGAKVRFDPLSRLAVLASRALD